MERRAKERLVGAAIIVGAIVLIVPELLSGPKHGAPAVAPLLPLVDAPAEPVRTVTVDLATSKATQGTEGAPASAVPDPPPATKPAPASTVPSVTTLEAQPMSQSAPESPPVATPTLTPTPPPVAARPPAASAPTPSDASHHSWAVQLGSFASRANAESLAHQLKARGDAVVVSASGAGKTLRYRVRMGPFADRASALQVVTKLKAQGHPSSVVPPVS